MVTTEMDAEPVDASVEQGQLQKQQQRERALTTGVGRLCFLNLFSGLMMIPARPEMVLRGTAHYCTHTSLVAKPVPRSHFPSSLWCPVVHDRV